jgi:polar amino acid transport system substrate-binding protein
MIVSVILIIAFSVVGCMDYSSSPLPDMVTIRAAGVEFSPNCFTDNGEIRGIDVDIARIALQNIGVKMEMGITESWIDAYNATLAGPKRALLTIAYSAERKDSFKWAGPTSQGMYGIFTKLDDASLYPLSIEKSKELEPIAVVKDWLETTTLENLGFTNLRYYDTYSDALSAFMNNEVKYISSDFFHLIKRLPAGYFLDNISTVTRYRTVFYYIAFSKDVDDSVVEYCQRSIETMIKNQTTNAIVNRYFQQMPADYIPSAVQLFTEDAQPYQYNTGVSLDRKVEGSSVEIVNEIQTRLGYVNKINLTTWTDAYVQPQYLPNSAVFTTARTPERESMFQWVGPISSNRTYFYTLASEGINIATLDQAKGLASIATPKNWYTHDFLISHNFENIVATSITSKEAFDQLVSGEVKALLLTDVDVKWLADKSGVELTELTQNMLALDFDGYIAFSLNTPESLVQQWQTKLDEMKTDGKFEAIWNKWYEGIEMP